MATEYVDSLVRAESSDSMFRKTGEFLVYAPISAVTSGVLSFVNTGIALGNALGGDFEQVDTEDTIDKLFGDTASSWYSDNQEIADTGGLILGSLVPGLGAVKLARSFAAGRLATQNTKLATGLRNALSEEAYMTQLKSAIRNSARPDAIAGNKLTLLQASATRNFTESLIYETATLLTMNQNPLLQSDDLEYFSSINNNLGAASVGVLLGTGIGGVAGYFSSKSTLTNWLKDTFKAEINSSTIPVWGGSNAPIGVAISEVAEKWTNTKAARARLEAISGAERDPRMIANLERLDKEHEIAMKELIKDATVGRDDLGEYLITSMQNNNFTPAQIADSLGQALKFRTVTADEVLGDMPLRVIEESELQQLPLLLDRYMGADVSPIDGLATLKLDLLGGKIADADIDSFYLQGAGLLDAQDIAALTKNTLIRRVNIKSPKGKILPKEDYPELAAYWDAQSELIKTPRKRKATANVSTLVDVHQDLLRISYNYDPAFRSTYDALSAQMSALHAMGDNALNLEALGSVWGEWIQLSTPQQLYANAYRVVNKAEINPELVKGMTDITGEFRGVFEWLRNNKALRGKFGSNVQFVDVQTLAPVNKVPVAHFSDLGPVRIGENKMEVGQGARLTSVSTTPAGIKSFKLGNPDVKGATSGVDSSAMYMWATAKHGAGKLFVGGKFPTKYSEALTETNFPMLEAVRNHYDFANGALKIGDTSISSVGELESFITAKKVSAIQEASKSGLNNLLSEQQLAIRLNVSDDFVTGAVAGRKVEHEAVTKDSLLRTYEGGREDFAPKHIAIEYDAQMGDLGVEKLKGSMYVQQRRAQAQQLRETIGRRILGEHANDLPWLRVDKTGALDVVPDITKYDETTGWLQSYQGAPDYFDGGNLVKIFGDVMTKAKAAETKAIVESATMAAQAVTRNKEALTEVSVLMQSVLPSGSYELLDDFALGLTADEMRFYNMLGIDVVGEITEKLYRANGLRTDMPSYGALITTETKQEIERRAAKLFFPEGEEELQSFYASLQSATSPEALQGITQLMRTRMDEVIKDVAPLFSSEAKVGGSKTIHNITYPESAAWLRTMQDLNNKWITPALSDLALADNRVSGINPKRLYSYGMQINKYPHVATVSLKNSATDPFAFKDRGMVFGRTADDLRQKLERIRSKYPGDQLDIKSYDQTVRDLKATGRYEADIGITDIRYDSMKESQGSAWNFVPEFDPDVINKYINTLAQHRTNLRIQGASLILDAEITAWRFMSNATTSKAIPKVAASQVVKEPNDAYLRNINQALGLRETDNANNWLKIQDQIDQAVSRGVSAIRGAWVQAATTGQWSTMNKVLDNYGLPKMVTSEDDWVLSIVKEKNSYLPEFIGRMNSMLSFGMIRVDTAHAMVNAISLPILASSEMSVLRNAIAKLPPEKQEVLMGMTNSAVDDVGTKMPSNMKLAMQAVKEFFTDSDSVQEFVSRGLIGREVLQYRQLQDGLAVALGSGKFEGIKSALTKASDFLATPTDKSEDFVKFVSGKMAKNMLDAAGIKSENPMYWATIHSFMSRVNGTYTASQRPELFQGWAGTALGLFQTYQFNFIQQLTRHLGDNKKLAAKMIGTQVSIFGTQSLPGWDYMNNLLADKTLGEKDFYTLTNEALDTPVAEFLLYGGGSSLTRPITGGKGFNLFTRGDLTPRTPIILPTKISEIPAWGFISNATKFMANTVGAITGDANTSTAMLEALAHNGMSRPLAGAAQLVLGQRTTRHGTALINYADADTATWFAKLIGSQTLNEAIVVDTFYRAQGFRGRMLDKLQELGTEAKQKIRSGELQQEDVTNLMDKYMQAGGRAETFNRWFKNQAANASVSSIEQLREAAGSPAGLYLQKSLGNYMDEFDRERILDGLIK